MKIASRLAGERFPALCWCRPYGLVFEWLRTAEWRGQRLWAHGLTRADVDPRRHRGWVPPDLLGAVVTERDVLLNELAQGLRPMSEGLEWFDGLDSEDQSEVLRFLRHHCVQARAVAEDASESIRRSGLRPTHTPAVLIARGRMDIQLGQISGLKPCRRTP